VVAKEYRDSFAGTELGAVLAVTGVRRLVLTGAQSQYCVQTTALSASTTATTSAWSETPTPPRRHPAGRQPPARRSCSSSTAVSERSATGSFHRDRRRGGCRPVAGCGPNWPTLSEPRAARPPEVTRPFQPHDPASQWRAQVEHLSLTGGSGVARDALARSGQAGKHPRIGILSPLVAGGYASHLTAGVVAAASATGTRVIAIQTLDLAFDGPEQRLTRSRPLGAPTATTSAGPWH